MLMREDHSGHSVSPHHHEESDFLRGMALPEVTHVERGLQIPGLPMTKPVPESGHSDKGFDTLSISELEPQSDLRDS